jgi:hypothetical protein
MNSSYFEAFSYSTVRGSLNAKNPLQMVLNLHGGALPLIEKLEFSFGVDFS